MSGHRGPLLCSMILCALGMLSENLAHHSCLPHEVEVHRPSDRAGEPVFASACNLTLGHRRAAGKHARAGGAPGLDRRPASCHRRYAGDRARDNVSARRAIAGRSAQGTEGAAGPLGDDRRLASGPGGGASCLLLLLTCSHCVSAQAPRQPQCTSVRWALFSRLR